MPDMIMAVSVVAAGLWTSPTAVRDIDAPALAHPVRVREWLAAQGPVERKDLWGRLDSQVLLGDLVQVDEVADGWARVVVPSQPTHKDPRGYPGWIPLAQLAEPAAETGRSVVVTSAVTDLRDAPDGAIMLADVGFATVLPLAEEVPGWVRVALPGGGTGWIAAADVDGYRAGVAFDRNDLVEAGRQFVGLMYLAGGAHGLMLDCSGLLHLIFRRYGHVYPRDANDAVRQGEPVAVEDVEFGDLLYFAKPDTGFVYHCGVCTGMPSMLHVSQTDWACLDEPMTDVRRGHLVGGRRIPLPGAVPSHEAAPPAEASQLDPA